MGRVGWGWVVIWAACWWAACWIVAAPVYAEQSPTRVDTSIVSYPETYMPVLVGGPPRTRQPVVPDSLEAPLTLPPLPPEEPAWVYDLVGRFAASQVRFAQWTEGGVNTVTGRARLEGVVERTQGSWSHTHQVRLTLGLVKQDTLAIRKAEDELNLRSTLRYQGRGFFEALNPTLASEVRTQFAPGFNYKKNPFQDDERKPPVRVSDFLAPAAFTQSIGLTFEEEWFKSRFGVGTKETVVLDPPLRVLYKLERDQPFRMEMGIESRTHVDKEVTDNVMYVSTLGLFAAFNRPELPDLLWENEVNLKVNTWLNVSFEFTALYDRDLNTVIQRKQGFAVGVSYDFI